MATACAGPGFWRRFAMVAGAAAAISVATYVAVPEAFIFFGILHQIALASLLGLLFLRLPALLNVVIAAGFVAAPLYLRSEIFDHPALWWVGLSQTSPRSNDYVPLFPWFGAVLAGIAAAQWARSAGVPARLAAVRFGAWSSLPQFGGRHSLAVYLLHQPVLIACIWLFSQVVPRARDSARSPLSEVLRKQLPADPRHGLLYALLWLHARHACKRTAASKASMRTIRARSCASMSATSRCSAAGAPKTK